MAYVNLHEYAEAAQGVLSEMAAGYYNSGAADEYTLRENSSAFERIKLWPHVLVDVSQRDLSTTVLGQPLDFPVMVAPTAMAALAHPEKELAIARAAKQAGSIMISSTMSTTSMEDLSTTDAPRWFQLYVHKDRGATRSMVQRAEAAGFKALVVTVDLPVQGYRDAVERMPVVLPEGVTLANLVDYWDRALYPTITNYVHNQFDTSLTWKDLEAFASSTSLPVLVKGILRPDDAKRAIASGAAGIVVSNHGGRQLDTVPAGIEALPYVVDAVQNQAEIIVDGGVRRGTDIIKALALGARAVLIGRPVLWGLAVDGQAGVERIFAILRHEYDLAMALCGVTSSQKVTRDLLSPM